ncbi:MAG: hypothetical protein ABI920_16540 [Casimicrobiaceae bacterium]
MHIVLIAWVYVIGMVAMTNESIPGGLLVFVIAGLAPVLLFVALKIRRLRAARGAAEPPSTLEQPVHDRDHRDP